MPPARPTKNGLSAVANALRKAIQELLALELRQHTELLRQHGESLTGIVSVLHEQSQLLREHNQRLHEHSQILREHGQFLHEHTQILRQHGENLGQLQGELRGVHGELREHSQLLHEHSQILREHSESLGSRSEVAGLRRDLESF